MRRGVRADAQPFAPEERRPSCRVVVDLPFVPTTWIDGYASCGSPSSASSARIRSSPNSSGHGESARDPVSRRRSHRARGGSARASPARPRRPRRARSAMKRSLASIFSARAISPRSRSRSASTLPFAFCRSGLTTTSKMRRSSLARAGRARRCAGRSRRPPARRRAHPPSASSPASGQGATISRVRAGRAGASRSPRSRAAWPDGAASAAARAPRAPSPARRRRRRKPRLDRLRVPVAEVVEGQVVELVDEVGEVERGEVPLDLALGLREAGEDPPLLERSRSLRRPRRLRRDQEQASSRSRASARASGPPRSAPSEKATSCDEAIFMSP